MSRVWVGEEITVSLPGEHHKLCILEFPDEDFG